MPAKKNLVIVESPAKAKTIEKYLGNKYTVKASMGHLRDLPKSSLGVDLETFEPKYISMRDKTQVIKELKTLCDKFRQIQEKRQACLNDYVKLISKDIPLCFLLRLYMNEYKQHLKDNEMRGVYKNYHIKHLNKYIAYIDHLIDDLDIRRSTVGEGEAPERLAALDLEEDVYGNNNVYTVVNRRDIDDLFFTEGQNNDNRNGGREE